MKLLIHSWIEVSRAWRYSPCVWVDVIIKVILIITIKMPVWICLFVYVWICFGLTYLQRHVYNHLGQNHRFIVSLFLINLITGHSNMKTSITRRFCYFLSHPSLLFVRFRFRFRDCDFSLNLDASVCRLHSGRGCVGLFLHSMYSDVQLRNSLCLPSICRTG